MILYPHCKINIGLDILRKREDGFHDIETVMLPVFGLHDRLEIRQRDIPGLDFTSSGLTIEGNPEDNLCVRAYNLIADRFNVPGATILLHKEVPFGAGLGGGSSDAAFTIRGLNELFELGMDDRMMCSLAAELGSDTSFFIRDTPQFASGRGEILEPFDLPSLDGHILAIVKPDAAVSTATAYARTTPSIPEIPLKERVSNGIHQWRQCLTNAFECSVFGSVPALDIIKNRLYHFGALYASLSGSGSALYALFEEDAFRVRNLTQTLYEIPGVTFVYAVKA